MGSRRLISRVCSELPSVCRAFRRIHSVKSVVGLLVVFTIFAIICYFCMHPIVKRNVWLDVAFEKAQKQFGEMTSKSFESSSGKIASVNCSELASGTANQTTLDRARSLKYRFRQAQTLVKFALRDTLKMCGFVKVTFGFNDHPLSEEEREFPLAYGALVYKWTDQILYMLGAFYQPQNLYCIAVDTREDLGLLHVLKLVRKCYSNIIVLEAVKRDYSGFSIVNNVFECLRALATADHKWKYYQYLTNFDLPLRSNHEMVRIFKRFNGSMNVELNVLEDWRLRSREYLIPKGMTIYQSNPSATFSRESANFMVTSKRVAQLLEFLNETDMAAESLWGTLAGNPSIGMPHSFNGAKWVEVLALDKYNLLNGPAFPYYVSRFQAGHYGQSCWGYVKDDSCVFGVENLPRLLKRPELVAHKFDINFEPVVFFCALKLVRERALRPIESFNDAAYVRAVPWKFDEVL